MRAKGFTTKQLAELDDLLNRYDGLLERPLSVSAGFQGSIVLVYDEYYICAFLTGDTAEPEVSPEEFISTFRGMVSTRIIEIPNIYLETMESSVDILLYRDGRCSILHDGKHYFGKSGHWGSSMNPLSVALLTYNMSPVKTDYQVLDEAITPYVSSYRDLFKRTLCTQH